MNTKIISVPVIVLALLSILLSHPHSPRTFSQRPLGPADLTFDVSLWTDGLVWYEFSTDPNDKLSDIQEDILEDQMDRWETTMTLQDPLNPAETRRYIDFEECPAPCNDRPHVYIRRNLPGENNNMCSYFDANDEKVGMNPDPPGNGRTVLHLQSFDENDVLHELGHCLGLWHEHNREDRDRWLDEGVWDWMHGGKFLPIRGWDLMPIIGNYDYDSLMHYASNDGSTLRFVDRLGNEFSRWESDAVSELDRSRLLQYYAWKHQPNWGFFRSLSSGFNNSDGDALPDPYLSGVIEAVGTPAVSYQSPGNFDIFALGSNQNLYWKSFRDNDPIGSTWSSLGCCFAGESAAFSRGNGQIDVFTIGAVTGKLVYNHLEGGVWAGWSYPQGGYPPGGIKPGSAAGYIGPAVASRNPASLDVFVVRTDGMLAVTTYLAGVWSEWDTFGGTYNVTARPAAIAQSALDVRLAINESGTNLYEPLVTFTPGVPTFELGPLKGHTANQAAPALSLRNDPINPYRVLITNPEGRTSHRFAQGRWYEIGGRPLERTGLSAVTTGPFSAIIVMNGEYALGCDDACLAGSPDPGGVIQPGGLWLRTFDGNATEVYYSFLPLVMN